MDAEVTAALISGGVAICVALIGIGGAIAAQLVSTRRSFEYSLALFERQHAEHLRLLREQMRREDAYRFAADRRSLYSRMLRLSNAYVEAREAVRTAEKYLERTELLRNRVGDSSEEVSRAVEERRSAVADARDRVRRLGSEMEETLESIQLLGSPPVWEAAERLHRRAGRAAHTEKDKYVAARMAFLEAARQELSTNTPADQAWPRSA